MNRDPDDLYYQPRRFGCGWWLVAALLVAAVGFIGWEMWDCLR